MEKHVIYSLIQWLYYNKKSNKLEGKIIGLLFFDLKGRDLCGVFEM